jgi:type II secretory pathway component PulL
MNEKEFGDALLGLDMSARSPADTRALTDRVLALDRRRVRLLTGVTVGAWLVAAGMVLLLLLSFGLLLPAMAKAREEDAAFRAAAAAGKAPAVPPDSRGHALEIAFKMMTVGITMTVGALTLAGLCTIGLVSATRRATLRQVNANLAEIAEQLKQLRRGAAAP